MIPYVPAGEKVWRAEMREAYAQWRDARLTHGLESEACRAAFSAYDATVREGMRLAGMGWPVKEVA